MAVGALGLISVVPPLHDAAYAFGLLQIVWFAWLGVMLVKVQAAHLLADPNVSLIAPRPALGNTPHTAIRCLEES